MLGLGPGKGKGSAMLLDFLPVLRGWEYRFVEFQSEDENAAAIPIIPGARQRIIEIEGSGWLNFAAAAFSTYYAELAVYLNQGKVKLSTSPYTVANIGKIGGFESASGQTIGMARKTVASPLVPEKLGSLGLPRGTVTTIRALGSNTGNVYLSYASLTSLVVATRFTLAPGQAVDVSVMNLDRVWLSVDVAGQGVEYIGEIPDTVNTTTAVFSISYFPNRPLPFHGDIAVNIENPRALPRSVGGLNTTATNILGFAAAYVLIVDFPLFLHDVREILGTLGASPSLRGESLEDLAGMGIRGHGEPRHPHGGFPEHPMPRVPSSRLR